jgi:hypothetical protein
VIVRVDLGEQPCHARIPGGVAREAAAAVDDDEVCPAEEWHQANYEPDSVHRVTSKVITEMEVQVNQQQRDMAGPSPEVLDTDFLLYLTAH